jgi:hypothetical protein
MVTGQACPVIQRQAPEQVDRQENFTPNFHKDGDMNKPKHILILSLLALSWALLACSLTTQVQPQAGILAASPELVTTPAMASPTSTQTAMPTPGPACLVHTGLPDGHVNLRTCAGHTCAVTAVLLEGNALAMLEPGTWSRVRTADGQTGYINSTYVTCEATK